MVCVMYVLLVCMVWCFVLCAQLSCVAHVIYIDVSSIKSLCEAGVCFIE